MTSPTPGTDFWDWDESRLLLTPKPHPAIQQADEPPTPPRLMIVGSGVGGNTSSTSFTISLTTKAGANNNVIVVAVASNSGMPVKSISGAGITNFRPYGGTLVSTGITSQLWWGVAANPLSAVTITATLTSGSNNISGSVAVAFAVNGCNTTWPWDNNINQLIINNTPSATITSSLNNYLMLFIPQGFGGLSARPAGFQFIGTRASGNDQIGVAAQLWSNQVVSRTITGTSGGNAARFVALTADPSLEALCDFGVEDAPSLPKAYLLPWHRLPQYTDPDEGWPQGSQPLPYPSWRVGNMPRALRIR